MVIRLFYLVLQYLKDKGRGDHSQTDLVVMFQRFDVTDGDGAEARTRPILKDLQAVLQRWSIHCPKSRTCSRY